MNYIQKTTSNVTETFPSVMLYTPIQQTSVAITIIRTAISIHSVTLMGE